MQTCIILLVIVISVGCNSSRKLIAYPPHNKENINNKTEDFSNTRQQNGYQPSGSSEYLNNELISEHYFANAYISDSITQYVVKYGTSENYSVNLNPVQEDTVITKNVELTELKEANQSFTMGLISFIALIGWMLSTYYLLLFFAIAFNLVAIVFGIAGLRKGIIAKRIIRKNKNIYSNANKANWGITLSLPIFVALLTIGIFLIYLISTGNFWLY